MADMTIRNNPDQQRFEILDDDVVIGFAAYVDRDEPSAQRIFHHTEVNQDYSGQGLAGRLAAGALDATISDDRRIIPVCPYIARYVSRHDYEDHASKPTPETLTFVEEHVGDQGD